MTNTNTANSTDSSVITPANMLDFFFVPNTTIIAEPRFILIALIWPMLLVLGSNLLTLASMQSPKFFEKNAMEYCVFIYLKQNNTHSD